MIESLRSGDKADLGQLNRIILARLQPQTQMPQSTPQVSDGTLVIVGGDSVPAEATERFVAAAGGTNANVALVSFDGDESEEAENAFMNKLRAAGVKSVQRVEFSSRQEADDPKLTEILKTAGGVWLCGARPQRCVESCLGSVAEQLCRDVLRRGGVIGGTAAGGLMQGEVLLNASPVPTKRMLTDGYDRGFAFLPGVAITSCTQIGETPSELTQLQKEHPQVVGLGIEDATALIVHGYKMEVVGKNQVAVLDSSPKETTPHSSVLQAGDLYDFRDRTRVARKDRE